ncbi:MAG: hypothetical protein KAH22_03405 [Thiotrichaceae bacterium]|nr:hypothetical protein [Thiotrichaceae bacterium]
MKNEVTLNVKEVKTILVDANMNCIKKSLSNDEKKPVKSEKDFEQMFGSWREAD